MTKPKIKIDVVSDVVCPWCYIGKRRIEKAMDELKDQFDFEVEYHPFELNPDLPKEGKNQKEYFVAKFGGEERFHQITRHVTEVAATEGLKFDFDKQEISPNTLDAHRLIAFAKRQGRQAAMKEALMSAYFEKGIDLSKDKNLIAVAVGLGMDEKSVTNFLMGEEFSAEIKMEEHVNRQRGISGVPFYIIDNKYGVSGAQSSETFVKALTEIGSKISSTADACNVEEKNC